MDATVREVDVVEEPESTDIIPRPIVAGTTVLEIMCSFRDTAEEILDARPESSPNKKKKKEKGDSAFSVERLPAVPYNASWVDE